MATQKLQVSILNFKEICRTCSLRGELIPIFHKETEEELDDEVGPEKMLLVVTNIKPDENDGLPQQICTKCYARLVKSYEYKMQCEKILAKLKSLADSEFVPVVIESILPVDAEVDDENSMSIKQESISEGDEPIAEYYDYVVAEEPDENEVVDLKYQTLEVLDGDVKEGTMIQFLASEDYETAEYIEDEEEEILEEITQEQYDEFQENDEPCMCRSCGKIFHGIKHLKIHMETDHPDEEDDDDDETEIFQVDLNNEEQDEKNPLTCNKCGETFTDSQQCHDHEVEHVLQSHVEIGDNGDIVHICEICYRAFPSKHGLSIHQAFHTNRKLDVKVEKPYECIICNKAFVSMKAMRNHKKTHGTKTYTCATCDKTFTIKARLQIHMRTHTGEKPYSCSDCGKCFGNTTSLRIHDLIHSGARPHYCKLCNRRFKQHSHLKNHMLTHSGLRPFDCPICGKTFVFKGNLTVHMRMHSGETPYVCSVCGKGFYDSSRMKKHRKTHDNKPYHQRNYDSSIK